MKYNSEFPQKVMDEMKSVNLKSFVDGYSFDIEGDFSMPPTRDVNTYLSDPTDEDMQDRITKLCLRAKALKIYHDGEPIGPGVIVTSVDVDWDVFEEFREHPLALMKLKETAGAFVLKKCLRLCL